MRNLLNINQIVTRNCGGRGAWLDNPLSSAAPGENIWPGFQLGGGGSGSGSSKRRRRMSYKTKHRNSRNSRNSRNNENNRNNRNSKKHNIRKISHRYKKTRRNI